MSLLAVNGGEKVRNKKFPQWPIFDETDEKIILEVVRSGVWGLGGTKIPEFQDKFAQYHQAKHGLCAFNGTVTLIVALRAAGVRAGDEVIVPPYTFMATATSVLAIGAIPVFVDIDEGTYCMDPSKIEAAITSKTKAIIPVHIAGHPADMDKIMQIAKKHNLVVIEDSAHAHGAEYNGKKVGAIGDLGSFSFQSTKNLCSGEGGIILTNDDELADKCFSNLNCGRIRTGAKYEHPVLGQNYRMSEFEAAILISQFERLEEQNKKRETNALYLAEKLSEIEGFTPQKIDPQVNKHSYHLFMVRFDKDVFKGISLESITNAITAEGIPASSGYKPLYKEALFESEGLDYSSTSCPVCEKVSEDTIWLTQNLLLGDKSDIDDIITAFFKIAEYKSELRK